MSRKILRILVLFVFVCNLFCKATFVYGESGTNQAPFTPITELLSLAASVGMELSPLTRELGVLAKLTLDMGAKAYSNVVKETEINSSDVSKMDSSNFGFTSGQIAAGGLAAGFTLFGGPPAWVAVPLLILAEKTIDNGPKHDVNSDEYKKLTQPPAIGKAPDDPRHPMNSPEVKAIIEGQKKETKPDDTAEKPDSNAKTEPGANGETPTPAPPTNSPQEDFWTGTQTVVQNTVEPPPVGAGNNQQPSTADNSGASLTQGTIKTPQPGQGNTGQPPVPTDNPGTKGQDLVQKTVEAPPPGAGNSPPKTPDNTPPPGAAGNNPSETSTNTPSPPGVQESSENPSQPVDNSAAKSPGLTQASGEPEPSGSSESKSILDKVKDTAGGVRDFVADKVDGAGEALKSTWDGITKTADDVNETVKKSLDDANSLMTGGTPANQVAEKPSAPAPGIPPNATAPPSATTPSTAGNPSKPTGANPQPSPGKNETSNPTAPANPKTTSTNQPTQSNQPTQTNQPTQPNQPGTQPTTNPGFQYKPPQPQTPTQPTQPIQPTNPIQPQTSQPQQTQPQQQPPQSPPSSPPSSGGSPKSSPQGSPQSPSQTSKSAAKPSKPTDTSEQKPTNTDNEDAKRSLREADKVDESKPPSTLDQILGKEPPSDSAETGPSKAVGWGDVLDSIKSIPTSIYDYFKGSSTDTPEPSQIDKSPYAGRASITPEQTPPTPDQTQVAQAPETPAEPTTQVAGINPLTDPKTGLDSVSPGDQTFAVAQSTTPPAENRFASATTEPDTDLPYFPGPAVPTPSLGTPSTVDPSAPLGTRPPMFNQKEQPSQDQGVSPLPQTQPPAPAVQPAVSPTSSDTATGGGTGGTANMGIFAQTYGGGQVKDSGVEGGDNGQQPGESGGYGTGGGGPGPDVPPTDYSENDDSSPADSSVF